MLKKKKRTLPYCTWFETHVNTFNLNDNHLCFEMIYTCSRTGPTYCLPRHSIRRYYPMTTETLGPNQLSGYCSRYTWRVQPLSKDNPSWDVSRSEPGSPSQISEPSSLRQQNLFHLRTTENKLIRKASSSLLAFLRSDSIWDWAFQPEWGTVLWQWPQPVNQALNVGGRIPPPMMHQGGFQG